MNIFIAILLLFALAGALDKLLGGCLGLSSAFDKGLGTMGELCLSMFGIYCIVVTVINRHPSLVSGFSNVLPFDPALFIGAILAPDMGAYAIAYQTAATEGLALFCGLLLSSTLGCLISFVLPISLGVIDISDTPYFIKGILFGVIVLPVGLLAGGLLLRVPAPAFFVNYLPLLLFCLILAAVLTVFPKGCLIFFSLLGRLMRIVSILLFLLTAAGIFFPSISVISDSLLLDAFSIVFRITLVVCGSMVASQLILTKKREFLISLGKRLGINEYAAVGLFLSLATSISMLPLFSKMDTRGKIANAAFTVSGAFVLGGQLAFVSSVAPAHAVTAYIICKLIGGIAAVSAALLLHRS